MKKRGYQLNPADESSRVVRELSHLDFGGNIIPRNWYRNLTTIIRNNEQPYLVAIVILAEIVYWYRPIVTSDDGSNGETIRKRFKGDLLQLSRRLFEKKFGFSLRQIDTALSYLEDEQLIERVLRTITTKDGRRIPNVMHIRLNFERLMEITDPTAEGVTEDLSTDRDTGMDVEVATLSTPGLGGIHLEVETNTKNTTEITKEREDRYSPNPSNPLIGSTHQQMVSASARVMLLDEALTSGRLGKFAKELLKADYTPCQIEVWFGDETEIDAVKKRYGAALVESIPLHGWYRRNHWAYLEKQQEPNEWRIRDSLGKIKKQLELGTVLSDIPQQSEFPGITPRIKHLYHTYGEDETRRYMFHNEFNGVANGSWFKFQNEWWAWIETVNSSNDIAESSDI
jgi:hypothetical protein